MRIRTVTYVAAVTLGAVTVLAACGDDGGGVEVTVSEWLVDAPESIEGGEVTFDVHNGGAFVHELVLVRSETADLPTKPDGSVDESQLDESAEIGEIEDIAVGKSAEWKVSLAAGDYVMFCNLVEEDEGGAHFAQGMVTTLTVTE
jgi:hypothetical protein